MRLTEIILINNDSLYVINEKKKLVYKVFPDVLAPTPTDADTPLLIIDSKKSHGPLQTLPHDRRWQSYRSSFGFIYKSKLGK